MKSKFQLFFLAGLLSIALFSCTNTTPLEDRISILESQLADISTSEALVIDIGPNPIGNVYVYWIVRGSEQRKSFKPDSMCVQEAKIGFSLPDSCSTY